MKKRFLLLVFISLLTTRACFAQADLAEQYSRIIVRLDDNTVSNEAHLSQLMRNKKAKKSRQLYLYCGKLKTIPEAVFNLTETEAFYIYGDSLEEMPASLNRMSKLKTLYIGPSKISVFKAKIELSSLEKFDIYSSRLRDFPEGIFQCKNLRFLGINRSAITQIPADVSKLEKLEYFGITDNRVTEIPEQLFACESLKYLVLEANKISVIPGGIARLKNLEELDVLGNPVKTYPDKLLQLEKLNYFFYGGHPSANNAFGKTPGDMDNYALTWKRVKKSIEQVYGKNRSMGKPGGVYYMLFMGFSKEKINEAAQSENIILSAADIQNMEQTALVKEGLGKAVSLEDTWNGKLKAGAVLGLSGKGNKPALFLEYIRKNGIITGIRYWEEGDSKTDGREIYQTYRDIHSKEFLELEYPNEIIRATNFN